MASRKDRARTRIANHVASFETVLDRIRCDAGTAVLTTEDVVKLSNELAGMVDTAMLTLMPPTARSRFQFATHE